MPRKTRVKPKPLYTVILGTGGIDTTILEVWNNLADIGERGSNRKRKAGQAFNTVFGEYTYQLLESYQNPNRVKELLRMLLRPGQTSKLVRDIKTFLTRAEMLGKTALWKVARKVQIQFLAIQNIFRNTIDNLPELPEGSLEQQIRQMIIKGTF
jgi:HPt (histidine-containing phosphotransfer) domain-containing protein